MPSPSKPDGMPGAIEAASRRIEEIIRLRYSALDIVVFLAFAAASNAVGRR
jgi:hypothetical protein